MRESRFFLLLSKFKAIQSVYACLFALLSKNLIIKKELLETHSEKYKLTVERKMYTCFWVTKSISRQSYDYIQSYNLLNFLKYLNDINNKQKTIIKGFFRWMGWGY